MTPVRTHVRTQVTWLAVMDFSCLILGGFVAVTLRFGPQELRTYVLDHLEGWLILVVGVMVGNYLGGTYQLQTTYSRFNQAVTWMFSVFFVLLILSLTSYSWFAFLLGRGVLALTLGLYSFFSLFLKLLIYRSLFRSEAFTCRSLILGIGDHARQCARLLESEYVLPAHKVLAYVRLLPSGITAPHGAVPTPGPAVLDVTVDQLADLTRRLDVHLVVLALEDPEELAAVYPAARRLRFQGIEVMTRTGVVETYGGRTPLDHLTEEILLHTVLQSGLPTAARLKRLMDVGAAVVGGALLLPVFLMCALLTKLSDLRSPVLYCQTRVGQFGRIFRIYKLRTMQPDAEAGCGPVWSRPDDPRVTPLGRWLRRFRLDEIPQLLNVLRGEMSLVGPRPERPEIAAELARQIPFYEERENVVPGLTGWAQIRYPYGYTIDDARRKLEYDLYYIRHMSLRLDVQILLSTLRIVVLGREFGDARVRA